MHFPEQIFILAVGVILGLIIAYAASAPLTRREQERFK